MMELDHLVPDGVDVDVPGVVNTTSNPDISLSNEDIGDYMKVLTDFESYDDEKNLEDLSTQDVQKPIDKIAHAKTKYEQCLTRQNEIDLKFNDLMRRINKARCQKYASHVAAELAVFRADISRSIGSKPKPPPTMDLVALQQFAEQAKPANIPDGITLPSVPAPQMPMEPHGDFKAVNKDPMLHVNHLFLSVEEKRKADDVLGQLDAGLRHLISSYDSDATDSSSGGESCDDYEDYPSTLGPETRTRSMPIRKRAKWRWLVSRSSVASKWSWLTAQISDLEYRIRQQAEIYRQIRASKGQIILEEPPKLPQPTNNTHSDLRAPIRTVLVDSSARRIVIKEPVPDLPDLDERGSCRTRPVRPFPRRKYISTQNFHKTSTRAARKSLFKCDCIRPLYWCSVCYGRDDHVQAPDPVSHERGKLVALMDHSYHQVLSSKNDVSLDLQMIHRLKDREWLQKITSEALSRSSAKLSKDKSWSKGKSSVEERRKLKKVDSSKKRSVSLRDGEGGSKKKSKLLKDRKQRPLILTNPDGTSALIDPTSDGNSTAPATPITPTLAMIEQLRRRRETAFDINNIVIPYSMASAGRVEKLVYKEIITPTFRLAEEVDEKFPEASLSDCEEDFSDPVFEQRHARAEVEEKNRWMQAFNRPGRSRGRRNDSRAEGNSGCNSPDPLSPIVTQDIAEGNTRPPSPLSGLDEVNAKVRRRRRSSSFTVSQDRQVLDEAHTSHCTSPIVMDHEEVPPYEPRKFPLTEEEYASMIEDMPTGFDSVVTEEEVPEDLPRVERSSPGGMPFSSSSTSPCEETEDDPDWAADDPDDPEWTRKNENASKEASCVPVKRRMISGGQK